MLLGLRLWCLMPQYFSYIEEVSFIGGGNQSTQRKPQTCCKVASLYYATLHLSWRTLGLSLAETKSSLTILAAIYVIQSLWLI